MVFDKTDVIEAKKEHAKTIAKVLRAYGISCGVIKGNGSTEPSNPKKFKNYFTIESDIGTTPIIYLNFKMDEKESKKIEKVLNKFYGLDYFWNGSDGSCFAFIVDVFSPLKNDIKWENVGGKI